MKVKELIKTLQEMQQDWEVCVLSPDDDEEVRDIHIFLQLPDSERIVLM